MTRRGLPLLVALALLAALSPTRAGAAGLGVYGEVAPGGGGELFWEDLNTTHRGCGVILDTAVARRVVLNYRLQVAYDHIDASTEYWWGEGSEADLEGVVLDQSLGFRLFQDEDMRVWLGPQVRLARYRGHGTYNEEVADRDRTDIEVNAIGFGPILGLNVNLPHRVTAALNLGFRLVFYDGDEEVNGDEQTGAMDYDYDNFTEQVIFFNLSLLGRIGE